MANAESKFIRVFALIIASAGFGLESRAQIGGSGWVPQHLDFAIHKPYNVPLSSRYTEADGVYHLWAFTNDAAFSAGNKTLPRTEHRFKPDYTSGEIQYQAMLMARTNENSYCIFQIHTGDAQSPGHGATTFMLFWFSKDGGSVHDYSGKELARNLGNDWFQLNVDHNLVTHTITVWINSQQVWRQRDNGASDFYFKDGVYQQRHSPTLQMDTFIKEIKIWTCSGQGG